MEPLEYFDAAAAVVADIVAHVDDADLDRPTPCPLWNVRAVLNHLALGAARVDAWVTERPAPDWESAYLGPDFRSDVARAVSGARSALSAPGALDRTVATAFGRADGALLIRMVVNEFLVHGWDVARATGQRTDFAPEVAEAALADARARLAGVPRVGGGPFASPQVTGLGSSAVDRLAAFLGRAPLVPVR